MEPATCGHNGSCDRIWLMSDNIAKVATAVAEMSRDLKHISLRLDEHTAQLEKQQAALAVLNETKIKVFAWTGVVCAVVLILFEGLRFVYDVMGG